MGEVLSEVGEVVVLVLDSSLVWLAVTEGVVQVDDRETRKSRGQGSWRTAENPLMRRSWMI